MPNELPDQLSIDDSGPRVRLTVLAMTRGLALLVALIPTVMLTLAEDQSLQNKSEGSDSFDAAPPILKQNLSTNRSAADAPGDAVARLEKKLEEQKEMPKASNASAKMGCFRKWKWSNAC
jgi:hypothetical protein